MSKQGLSHRKPIVLSTTQEDCNECFKNIRALCVSTCISMADGKNCGLSCYYSVKRRLYILARGPTALSCKKRKWATKVPSDKGRWCWTVSECSHKALATSKPCFTFPRKPCSVTDKTHCVLYCPGATEWRCARLNYPDELHYCWEFKTSSWIMPYA